MQQSSTTQSYLLGFFRVVKNCCMLSTPPCSAFYIFCLVSCCVLLCTDSLLELCWCMGGAVTAGAAALALGWELLS